MQTRRLHSWEEPAAKRPALSWESRHVRVAPDLDDNLWGTFSNSGAETELEDEETAGQKLVNAVPNLHLLSKISAEDCCTTLQAALDAGIVEAQRYALLPGNSSGHYARKLREPGAQGDSSDFYEFTFAGHAKHELSRTIHTTFCIPLHDQIADDIAQDVGCRKPYKFIGFGDKVWCHPWPQTL